MCGQFFCFYLMRKTEKYSHSIFFFILILKVNLQFTSQRTEGIYTQNNCPLLLIHEEEIQFVKRRERLRVVSGEWTETKGKTAPNK